MTSKAKGPDILQPALSPAFDDRHDMICSPRAKMRFKPGKLLSKHIERPVTIRITFYQPRKMRRLKTSLPQQASEDSFDLIAINAADAADASIPAEDLLSQIPRIASKLVLVDTGLFAERPTPFRHFLVTPTAKRPAIRPSGKPVKPGPTGLRANPIIAQSHSFLSPL